MTSFDHSIPFRRSTQDRYLAGVCAGLARHFHVDPTLMRVGAVVLTLFTGAPVVAYAACWLLMDEDPTF